MTEVQTSLSGTQCPGSLDHAMELEEQIEQYKTEIENLQNLIKERQAEWDNIIQAHVSLNALRERTEAGTISVEKEVKTRKALNPQKFRERFPKEFDMVATVKFQGKVAALPEHLLDELELAGKTTRSATLKDAEAVLDKTAILPICDIKTTEKYVLAFEPRRKQP